jgi:hypothetical protein
MHTIDLEALRKRERMEKRALAAQFVDACRRADRGLLIGLVGAMSEIAPPFAWRTVARAVCRADIEVTDDLRDTFKHIWIASKNLPLKIGDHSATIGMARKLMPKYSGPSVRLFRGTTAGERRRRIYGLSWSEDASVAEKFAWDRRTVAEGSVVMETTAPPEAIVAKIAYSEPLTEEEKADLCAEHPNAAFHEYHGEQEYVVDRRFLSEVRVLRRYDSGSTRGELA